MDFMKIIKSLELLLYELMVWFVFYPRTLWLAVTAPLKLMAYADAELGDEDEDRYSDTLSPPIFLAITLALVHLVEIAGALNVDANGMLADDKNLIAFRLIAFAIFPLMLSLRMLRAKGIALDRKTLRAPFYAQCFVVAPFAIIFDVAAILLSHAVFPGVAALLFVLAFAWYLSVQTLWLRTELATGWLRGFLHALRAVLTALFFLLLLTIVVSQL